jgi:hypothetical protein
MNAYFAGNDYQVIDRTDFPKAFGGLRERLGRGRRIPVRQRPGRLDQAHAAGKPFLAHIMTTSNHRPYTYPDGRIDIPSPGGRERRGEIHRLRHRPLHRAGRQEALVRRHPVRDRGGPLRVRGRQVQLPVKGYHIPLISLCAPSPAPGPQRPAGSQIDIPPTLLDVMGLPGDGHFFGKSLFEQGKDAPRAFISNYQELGYLKEGRLTVLGPKKRVEAYLVDANGDARPSSGGRTPARRGGGLLPDGLQGVQAGRIEAALSLGAWREKLQTSPMSLASRAASAREETLSLRYSSFT